MADRAKQQPQTRTFVKKGPDGETLTRSVTSAQAEVEARFDGFFPEDGEADAAKAPKSSGGRSGNAANTGGGSNASSAS